MADDFRPPGQSDEEMEALALLVAKNLSKGESPASINRQLVDSGWDEDDAINFVNSIQRQLMERQDKRAQVASSNASGWLFWVGLLVLVNLLSYLFNWGLWLF